MANGFLIWARDRIADMFAPPAEATGTSERVAKPRRAAPAATESGTPSGDTRAGRLSTALERKLRQIAEAGGGRVMAGKVHFVNLAEVQERLGPLWERKREFVLDIASSVIAQHLTAKDLFTRVGDTAFVMVFAQLGKEDAQVKCALIAEQILKRIFGEEATLDSLQVQSVVAEVEGSLIFESVNPVEVLDRMVSRAGPEAEAPVAPRRPLPAIGTLFEEGPDVVPDSLGFFFRPMWSVRRGAVTTYLCYPSVSADGRGPHTDYHALPRGEDSSLVGELDLMTLHNLAAAMAAMRRKGEQVLLAGTVHLKTLENRDTRSEFIAMCQAIPERLRRLMIYEIAGMPLDRAPETRIAQAVSSLRPFVQAVVLRCGLEDRRLSGLRMLGVNAVSLHLGPGAPSEERLLREMNRFVEAAGKAQLRTVAHGLPSKSLATIAIGAGFTYIDGEAVTPPTRAPAPMRKFDLEDFYR